jgi:hypothetical protein
MFQTRHNTSTHRIFLSTLFILSGTSRFSFRVPAPATTIAIIVLARFKPEDYGWMLLLASATPNPLPVGPFWVGNHLVPFMQTWQDRDIVTKKGIIA